MVVNHDVVSNLFRFFVALAFLPGIFSIGRRIRMPEARTAFLVAILALIMSFGSICIEQQFADYVPWLRYVRHAMVAVSGFGFAWAAWKARQHELALAEVRR